MDLTGGGLSIGPFSSLLGVPAGLHLVNSVLATSSDESSSACMLPNIISAIACCTDVYTH